MMICIDTTIEGNVNEDILVSSNCRLVLRGISTGHIELQPGSECIVYGIHRGNIYVDHASCRIYGILNGAIDNCGEVEIFGICDKFKFSGNPIAIHNGAVINEHHYSSDD